MTNPAFAVSVDIVMLTMLDGRLHVLLVHRDGEPHARSWALPGGFKQPDESLDEAAARALRDETSVVAPAHLRQFGAYGDPGRDPREHVVTIAYLAVVAEIGTISAGTDAAAAQLWPVADVFADVELAFDHRQILTDAVTRAAADLDSSDLATAFVGPTFTLSELQHVYEELWGDTIDPANFRRSLAPAPAPAPRPTAAGAAAPAAYVEPTGLRGSPGRAGGRPPELFRAGDAWKDAPPIRRKTRRKPNNDRTD